MDSRTVKIPAKAIVEVELTDRDVADAIWQVIHRKIGPIDDAGCDWATDDQGYTYILYYPKPQSVSDDPYVAALVNAAHILAYGERRRIDPVEGGA